jgi:hypothetical protein
MSDKIKSHHLGRKSILYVRQSSIHQVMHNQESRLLQYAMRDRLCALGWREIEVVDDDLASGLPRGLCRLDAFRGDPQDVGKQPVWRESSWRGQARRIASCRFDALSTLRSEDDLCRIEIPVVADPYCCCHPGCPVTSKKGVTSRL